MAESVLVLVLVIATVEWFVVGERRGTSYSTAARLSSSVEYSGWHEADNVLKGTMKYKIERQKSKT